MMDLDKLFTPILAIVSGIIVLAIIAVLVSKNAQTSTVISSTGSALSSIIGSAISPVTGSSSSTSTSGLTSYLSALGLSTG